MITRQSIQRRSASLLMPLLTVVLVNGWLPTAANGQASAAAHGVIDATATRLNPEADKLVFTTALHNMTFSSDSHLLAAGQGTGRVFLWNLHDGQPVDSFRAHDDWTFTIAFDSSSEYILTGGGDNKIHLWKLDSLKQPVRSFLAHTGDVHAIALTPDGKRMVSAGDDMTPLVWDFQSGHVENRLPQQARQIPGLAISPDGQTVATVNRQGQLQTFDVESGQSWLTIQAHETDIITVVYSPDGQRLITGGYDGTVAIWDEDMGYLIKRFSGHEGPVVCIDISPDGQNVLSVQGDRALLWAVNSKTPDANAPFKEFKPEMESNEQISFCRFSPDGNHVAVATTGGRIFLLDSDLTEKLHILSAIDDFDDSAGEKD